MDSDRCWHPQSPNRPRRKMGRNKGFTCSKMFTTSTQLTPPAMQRKRVKHVRLSRVQQGRWIELAWWLGFLGIPMDLWIPGVTVHLITDVM